LIEQIFSQLPASRSCNLPSALFAVPGKDQPRWIVPSGRSLNYVLGNWSPYKFSSRLKWRVIRTAQHFGAMRLLPGVERISIADATGVNWSAVGWPGRTPPVPVIYIGTPGPRQKAILHLVDPASGECHAIVKVPLRAAARAAILRESDVLAVLEDELHACAPSVLSTDRSSGVAAQQFLFGACGNRRFLPEYQDLLRSLVLPDEHTTLAGHTVAWQDDPLWDFMERSELDLLATALAEQADTSRVPAYWVHGDFAPWNIRNRYPLPAALIDWEMAERAGLPLQDAFHFFHMQDFLFSGGPRSHFSTLETFAKSLGISAPLSRKLEIAYLAQSYFRCAAWEERQRASFLLKTLAIVLRERSNSSVPVGAPQNRRLRLVSSRAPQQDAVRAELLAALVAELGQQKIPYCILSGYETAASAVGSDVDIMFRPADLHRLPSILSQAGHSVGAKLVQSIRHETSACYFVLAKAQGKHVANLAIDCYGDYRRDGRTWLQANALVANRRRYREFYRPSIADEFIYRLVKKVLKRSISEEQLKQLQHLFARDATECRQRIARFWLPQTAVQLERAVAEQNCGWFREQLPALHDELCNSPKVQGAFTRTVDRLREAGRLIGRALRPTGMIVRIEGEACSQQSDLADRLLCSLAPAFRRTRRVSPLESLRQALRQDFHTLVARTSSTLVIETSEPSDALSTTSSSRFQFARMLAHPDLTLHLYRDGDDSTAKHRTDLRLDADDFPDRVEQANIAILNWMAARTGKRLNLRLQSSQPVESPAPVPAETVEFEFAGPD
jgi:hypothetical protein